MQVYATDFYNHPDEVIRRIKMRLGGKDSKLQGTLPDLTEFRASSSQHTIDAHQADHVAFVYLEFRGEGSAKFWKIARKNALLEIFYGKIGSEGRRIIKEFGSGLEAENEKEKLVRKKLNKGYSLAQN